MKAIHVKTVLVDIDNTLTENIAPHLPESSGVEILADFLLQRDQIPPEQTRKKLALLFDPERECLTTKLHLFGVSRREFWDLLLPCCLKHFRMLPDAVTLLKTLHELPVKVYTATTNSEFTSRMKLASGLDGTDYKSCKYIDGYYPGNAFNDPRGKYAPDFISKIILDGRFDPQTTVMIGDDPRYDLYPAQRAGIRYCVIVKRTMREKYQELDGAIYVNSLQTIAEAIRAGTLTQAVEQSRSSAPSKNSERKTAG